MPRRYGKPNAFAPICDCCGVGMRWTKDSKLSEGGRWRCTTRSSRDSQKWIAKNKAKQEEYCRKYGDKMYLLDKIETFPWYIEDCWPVELKIAQQIVGGSNEHVRSEAEAKLRHRLEKEGRPWLAEPIMSRAMQTTRVVRRFPLSLESSRGD